MFFFLIGKFCVNFFSYSKVKGKFQLLGVASMFIAGKLEEIYPPFAEEWSVLTAKTFTREQIRRMEKILLNAIDFDVQPPTVLTFIEQLCNELNMDRKILYLAMVREAKKTPWCQFCFCFFSISAS